MSTTKTCDTCKYAKVSAAEYPCTKCIAMANELDNPSYMYRVDNNKNRSELSDEV